MGNHHKRHGARRGKDNKVAFIKKQRIKDRDDHLVDEAENQNGAIIDKGHTRPKRKSKKSSVRGRGDSGKLLLDEKRIAQDTKLIHRAVRNKWGVRRKSMIRRRLEEIVQKEEVDILTKQGIFNSTEAADRNATQAARVLVAMNAQDQADDFQANKKDDKGIQVNVNTIIEPGRSRVLQLAERFGTGHLIIDGKQVSTSELAGQPLQAREVQNGSGK